MKKLLTYFALGMAAALVIFAPPMMAQVQCPAGVIGCGGSGGMTQGSPINGATGPNAILTSDSSGNLLSNPASVVNGSVSTAGRSILTIRDTITGGSATSNFLNITGAFPATLSAETNAINVVVAVDNDGQLQNVIRAETTGAGGSVDSAIHGITNNTGTYSVGVLGESLGATTNSIGVLGYSGAGTIRVAGYFTLASAVPAPGATAALIADNGAVAGNIFCGADNGTCVFTIADGGQITKTGVMLSANGTEGAPAYAFTGTPNYGVYINVGGGENGVGITQAGTTVSTWSASGLATNSTYRIGWSSGNPTTTSFDAFFMRHAAASIQLGADANGALTAQFLTGPNGITGTDIVGGVLNLGGQVGTGAGAGSQTNINRAVIRATGTTAQVASNAFTTCESKTLSNTSATATAIVNITLPNNSAGAGRATISVQCNDGTNFDSDLVTTYDSYVNKAGTLTIGTPVTTGTSAANNSGSCTVAPTWVANGTTSIDLKVTPVIGTIVPTTTTAVVNFENLGGVQGGGGVVTCK